MQIFGGGGEGKNPARRRRWLTCESAAPAGGTGERRRARASPASSRRCRGVRRAGWRFPLARRAGWHGGDRGSWHPLVLSPSERVAGCGRRERQRNGCGGAAARTSAPRAARRGRRRPRLPPRLVRAAWWGRVSAAAGGRGVKFTVSGGGRMCCGRAVSPPWHRLACRAGRGRGCGEA